MASRWRTSSGLIGGSDRVAIGGGVWEGVVFSDEWCRPNQAAATITTAMPPMTAGRLQGATEGSGCGRGTGVDAAGADAAGARGETAGRMGTGAGAKIGRA